MYFESISSYDGAHNLTDTGWNDDYGIFLYVCEDRYYDSSDEKYYCSKIYFQREGTLNITNYEFNFWGTRLTSITTKLTGVVLEQINNSGAPVAGGGCFKIKDTTLNYEE